MISVRIPLGDPSAFAAMEQAVADLKAGVRTAITVTITGQVSLSNVGAKGKAYRVDAPVDYLDIDVDENTIEINSGPVRVISVVPPVPTPPDPDPAPIEDQPAEAETAK